MKEPALAPASARQFASPAAQDDPQPARALLGEYARALLQIALEQAGVNAAAPELARARALVGDALPWPLAWRPALGRLEQALFSAASPQVIRQHVRALVEEPAARSGTGGVPHIAIARADAAPLPSDWQACADPAGAAAVAEACRLLAEHDPAYARWVDEAVVEVMLLERAEDIRFSATVREAPGLVFLSAQMRPLEIAARLVHEASHQNFYALERIAPLHDGTDETLYQSPIKQRGRPLEAILFSFHAFGNGAVFHRRLAAADPRHAVLGGASLATSLADLALMAGHLQQTAALTPAGEQLWRPLAAELFN